MIQSVQDMSAKNILQLLLMLCIGIFFLCCIVVFKHLHLPPLPGYRLKSKDRQPENTLSSSGHEQNQPHQASTEPLPLYKKRYDLHPPNSKDLIVHAAYFDRRPRDNHANVTVILLNVNMTILNRGWVIGCGVNGKNATTFTTYSVFENELMHNWLGRNPFTYENVIVFCYDMPGKNGSEVYVLYKTGAESREIKVVSQYPLYVPASRVNPSGGYNFTAVTCTKIHNKGVTFFHEFVRYQRTLGVDHVHVDVLDFFLSDHGFEQLVVNDSYLLKEYKSGYLSFSIWKEWYQEGKWNKGDVYLHSESLRKLGCIYRYIGTYDYAMPLDTDDFFVPRIPGKNKLKDYILQYCYSKPAGSCRFQWVWHYPKCGLVGNINDGNVTEHLKTKIYNRNEAYNFKSVHSTRAVLDASFHDARCPKCLLPGYKLVHIPTSIAYVAHNRYAPFVGRSPCSDKAPLL